MQAGGAESGTVMPIHRFVAAVIRELPLALYRVPEGIDRRSDAGTVLVAVPAPTDRLLSGEQFHELKVSKGSPRDGQSFEFSALNLTSETMA